MHAVVPFNHWDFLAPTSATALNRVNRAVWQDYSYHRPTIWHKQTGNSNSHTELFHHARVGLSSMLLILSVVMSWRWPAQSRRGEGLLQFKRHGKTQSNHTDKVLGVVTASYTSIAYIFITYYIHHPLSASVRLQVCQTFLSFVVLSSLLLKHNHLCCPTVLDNCGFDTHQLLTACTGNRPAKANWYS